jgi:hypothetical protein
MKDFKVFKNFKKIKRLCTRFSLSCRIYYEIIKNILFYNRTFYEYIIIYLKRFISFKNIKKIKKIMYSFSLSSIIY